MRFYIRGDHAARHGDGAGTGALPITNPLGGDPSPEGGGLHVVGMSHCILGGDAHGTDTPDHVGLGAVGLHLITAGNPLELTGSKVRAGGESRHRVGCRLN